MTSLVTFVKSLRSPYAILVCMYDIQHHKELLDRGMHLADVADTITLRYYLSANLAIEEKPDTSPVTQGDLETEHTLQKIVHDEFGDAYLGEEGTRVQSQSGLTWIIDPIDATKNFLRGMPVWATLIALRDSEGLLVSVVSAPALGRRWWAVRDQGAFTKDTSGAVRQLHVSRVGHIEDAYLGYASLFSWNRVPVGAERVMQLLESAWRHRAVGDFLNYMLVAEGAIDACFEPDPKQWDLDAPSLIVTEAGGGIWTTATEDTPAEGPRIVIGSNGLLETPIRESLGLASPS